MPLLNDTDSNLMTQNIVFAICGVHSLMEQSVHIDPPAFWSTLEQHEMDRFLRAFDLLDSRKGRFFMHLTLTFSVSTDNDPPDVHNTQYVLVSLLLRKMGKIALQKDAIQVDGNSLQ
ncbi:hypothetical protein PIB30_094113 [Stylosanthes scabra]|uniref:Uncharacterized protein n=1 Tax=Stylosanthes scabra TaxID=79078 RepID=A0ABU6ZTY0_9FABA|nr:hypothetical protein [Stylosanthes scabra]